MSALNFVERPAVAEPAGLLVLHHGRGADELDLLGLADLLDPARALAAFSPRAPLTLPGWPGYHWYELEGVGRPSPQSFAAGYAALAAFHDELWARTGLGADRTVLGGFSMGAAMSYALGLGGDRPAPAGILAFSGVIPTVDGWQADLAARRGLPAFVAHGRADQVIDVSFGRQARSRLEEAGLQVSYHESGLGHEIDPAHLPAARAWIAQTLEPGALDG